MAGVLADERMSDVDALVWAVERRPRNRTTIAALARFAAPLDDFELQHRVDRASRVVRRLRQRVVHDPLDLTPPRWSIDPDFDLDHHLRSRQLEQGDDRDLARVIRDLIVHPFDRARPLWEFTHITGLADGGAALLLKTHHAVSDGVGGVEMMLELFDLAAEPTTDRARLPPAPDPSPPAPSVADVLRHEVSDLFTSLRNGLDVAAAHQSIPDVVNTSRRIGEALGSAARMFSPARGTTVMPTDRSDDLDLRFLSVPLEDLRRAGRRVDGTINDAFVTAVALGVKAHSRALDAPLRVMIPLNTRTEASTVGNHWTPGRIEIDLRGTDDADLLCAVVKRSMRRLRDEPAHGLLSPLAAGLRRLPSQATASLFESMTSGLDVAASNVPGSPVPLHLCGQPVVALVPFGPLSGCAVNVTLMSHVDEAHIGISSDPAAVSNPDALAHDIERALATVVDSASTRDRVGGISA